MEKQIKLSSIKYWTNVTNGDTERGWAPKAIDGLAPMALDSPQPYEFAWSSPHLALKD